MKFLYSLLLFIPTFLFGQTRVEEQYYDSLNEPVLFKEHAKFLRRTTLNDTFPNKWMKEKIDILDSIHIDRVISKDYYTAENSDTFKLSICYNENKSIESIIFYKNYRYNGVLKTFYKSGNIKRIDTFKNNKLISGKCFKLNGEDTIHFEYSIPPKFKGGEQAQTNFFNNNLKYPEAARDNEIEGVIIVVFIIEKDGTVSNVKTNGKGHKLLQQAAIDLIIKTSRHWEPGYLDGSLIKVKVKMPIEFSIE